MRSDREFEFRVQPDDYRPVPVSYLAGWIQEVVHANDWPNPYPPHLPQPNANVPRQPNPVHGAYSSLAAKLVGLSQQAVSALQSFQAGALDPPTFEAAVQKLIDQRYLLIPNTRLHDLFQGVRNTSALSALIARAMVANIDFTDLMAGGANSAILSQEGSVGFLWGAYLRGTPMAAASTAAAQLTPVAKAEISAMIEVAIAKELSSLATVKETALNALLGAGKDADDSRASLEKLKNDLERLLSSSTDELKNIKKAFSFEGATRAAFDHWDSKATEHKWRSYVYLGSFVFLALVGVGGLIGIENWLIPPTVRLLDLPFAPLTIFLMTAGACIWLGRLLTKQFATERYLLEDAAERAALIRTFASMIRDGQLAGDKGDVVLPALFRPAMATLPRDDSAPLLPLEAIAKLISKEKH